MYIPWLTSVCGGSYISIYIYTGHGVYNPTYHWGASAYSVMIPRSKFKGRVMSPGQG